MEKENCLGIYLSKNYATVTLLSGQDNSPLTCFTVTPDTEQESASPSLARQISNKLEQSEMTFVNACVAIDCSLFTQHKVHSQLTDPKQIAQTIRFDAEEAIAADAVEMAIAFNINSIEQTGSDVTVFAAKIQDLTDFLTDLQQFGIDPTVMEPDTICLTRFFRRYVQAPPQTNPIIAVFSTHSCYLITPSESEDFPAVRSFLVSPSQDKTRILTREIPITLASMSTSATPDSLMIAGQTDDIDCDFLTERLGLQTTSIKLLSNIDIDINLLAECSSSCDFAIAYGSALAETTRTKKSDFRQDFSPYQGKKMVMEKMLRIISIALTILLFAVAGYFQFDGLTEKRKANTIKTQIAEDYAAVMYGKEPPKVEPVYERLKREYNVIKQRQSGQTVGDDNSITAKLTFILEAINSVPKVDLNIDTVSITSKSIRIIGDTGKRTDTRVLFDAIKKHPKLKLASQTLNPDGSRDRFTITVE